MNMLGVCFLLVTALLPVIWWFPSASFGSGPESVYSITRLSALVGVVIFSQNFLLASRYFWVESLFRGLGKIYKVHHWTGIVAYVLLGLHGGLIIYINRPNWQYPFSNNFILLGAVAFGLLTCLLALTLIVKLPYHVWKRTHQLMGIALLFGSVHGLMVGSSLATSGILRLYILTWIAIGLSSAIVRFFNVRLKFHGQTYQVSEILTIRDWVIIKLTPVAKDLKYFPGQFVFTTFYSEKISTESHPFSLAGSPADNYLTIVAKAVGDYTKTLPRLKKGDRAWIEGAYGRFNQRFGKYKKQIWIAGGIGITPFRGMILEAVNSGYEIDMFYAVSRANESLFDQEFRKLAKDNSGFRYTLWNSDKMGRISAEKIKDLVGEIKNKDIFVCGPISMIRALTTQFIGLGVRYSSIHSDEFALY